MTIKITIISVLFLWSGVVTIAQTKQSYPIKYASPVDFDITLAGNVGEIRSHHFHTGIDIKALRGIGSPVLAVADGYVSRIGVAPSGYGNFMMITHPDGTSSLYGHLHRFAADYQAYLETWQRKNQSYAADLYLPAGQFPVKSGQRIAYLGNSGASGGPHLHFEIRNSENQNPINLLHHGIYKVSDHIPPSVFKIHVYQQEHVGHTAQFIKTQTIDLRNSHANADNNIIVARPFYLAYEVIDYQDGRTNTFGIYSLSQRIDNQVNFSFKIDELSFATNRYVNTLLQYDENLRSPYSVLRTYISPNNLSPIYQDVLNNGIITPPPLGQTKRVITTFTDDSGNTTTVSRNIIGSISPPMFIENQDLETVLWNQPYTYTDQILKINIPSGTLYESTSLAISQDGNVYTIGSEDIPLQKRISIHIASPLPAALQSKALIARINDKGRLTSVGGTWNTNGVQTQTNTLGKFKIMVDTIPPSITPKQASKQSVTSNYIAFKITDNLSGIASYRVLIDNQWEIPIYDPKFNTLSVQITPQSMRTNHSVSLQISDNKENTTTLDLTYLW